MEKVIDLHIRNLPSFGQLCTAQHAYCKGRSVETALHEVVGRIGESLHHKEYTMVAFLDIKGVFNNLEGSSISNALVEFGVEEFLGQWIGQILSADRSIRPGVMLP